MTEIKILGPGCPNCTSLYQNTEQAAKDLGLDCTIDKVTDINEIISFGVMMTPALVVDDEIKALGKVPSVEEIKDLLK